MANTGLDLKNLSHNRLYRGLTRIEDLLSHYLANITEVGAKTSWLAHNRMDWVNEAGAVAAIWAVDTYKEIVGTNPLILYEASSPEIIAGALGYNLEKKGDRAIVSSLIQKAAFVWESYLDLKNEEGIVRTIAANLITSNDYSLAVSAVSSAIGSGTLVRGWKTHSREYLQDTALVLALHRAYSEFENPEPQRRVLSHLLAHNNLPEDLLSAQRFFETLYQIVEIDVYANPLTKEKSEDILRHSFFDRRYGQILEAGERKLLNHGYGSFSLGDLLGGINIPFRRPEATLKNILGYSGSSAETIHEAQRIDVTAGGPALQNESPSEFDYGFLEKKIEGFIPNEDNPELRALLRDAFIYAAIADSPDELGEIIANCQDKTLIKFSLQTFIDTAKENRGKYSSTLRTLKIIMEEN